MRPREESSSRTRQEQFSERVSWDFRCSWLQGGLPLSLDYVFREGSARRCDRQAQIRQAVYELHVCPIDIQSVVLRHPSTVSKLERLGLVAIDFKPTLWTYLASFARAS